MMDNEKDCCHSIQGTVVMNVRPDSLIWNKPKPRTFNNNPISTRPFTRAINKSPQPNKRVIYDNNSQQTMF